MQRNDFGIQDIDIAEYLEGKITGAAREEFNLQIQNDSETKNTVNLSRQVLDDRNDEGNAPAHLVNETVGCYPKPPDIMDLVVSLTGRAIEILNISPGTEIMTPVQIGMVRGTDAAAPQLVVVSKTFNRARVDVHIESLRQKLCQFTVQVRDTAGDGPLQNARADLVSGWRELASNPLEAGTTQFEDVGPGRYDLIVRKNDAVVGRMTIKIASA